MGNEKVVTYDILDVPIHIVFPDGIIESRVYIDCTCIRCNADGSFIERIVD
jgi:hypothetical protein